MQGWRAARERRSRRGPTWEGRGSPGGLHEWQRGRNKWGGTGFPSSPRCNRSHGCCGVTRGMEAVVAKLCSALRALFPSWSRSEEQEAGQRGGKECLAAAPAQDKEAGSRKGAGDQSQPCSRDPPTSSRASSRCSMDEKPARRQTSSSSALSRCTHLNFCLPPWAGSELHSCSDHWEALPCRISF